MAASIAGAAFLAFKTYRVVAGEIAESHIVGPA
jgi:hypothetical protein